MLLERKETDQQNIRSKTNASIHQYERQPNFIK